MFHENPRPGPESRSLPWLSRLQERGVTDAWDGPANVFDHQARAARFEGVGFGGCFQTSVALPPRLTLRADRRLHGLVGLPQEIGEEVNNRMGTAEAGVISSTFP